MMALPLILFTSWFNVTVWPEVEVNQDLKEH